MEKLWTTSEVATFLGIDEGAVEQLVREGKLTGYQLGGQFLRFRPDQVKALHDTLTTSPAPRGGTSPATPKGRRPRAGPWVNDLRDFLYFYDFYVVSATLLAVTVVYLLLAG